MIGIYGAGAFGTGLAISYARAGHTVRLFARDASHLAEMEKTRQNARYLPDMDFPDAIELCENSSDLDTANLILMATPAQSLRMVLAGFQTSAPLVLCAKGLENSTRLLQSEIAEEFVGIEDIAVLTGPSFAIDLAAGHPTALSLAAHPSRLEDLQKRLSTSHLRIYANQDIKGVQIGGALKNIYAIACGLVEGSGLGDSAKAALMTRSFAELSRFAVAQGAQTESLFGLSGFGDLVLTCSSPKSRNFAYGIEAAKRGPFTPNKTVEGLVSTQVLAEWAAAEGFDMPICTALARFLAGDANLQEIQKQLLARPLSSETT